MSILQYIETFNAVAELGSFTAASEALGVSKPVVSKQITTLEQKLGVQLLNRTTRRLHLTQAGEMFASYSKRIMEEAHEAENSVLPLQTTPKGVLRVSVPESLALSLLPAALGGFQKRYPQVELDVKITGKFIDLIADGVDVAIRMGVLRDSSLIARQLMPCGFYICGSSDYFSQHGRPTHPDELTQHNCLIYSQGQNPENWMFEAPDGKAFSIRVKGNFRSDTGYLLLKSALDGHGLLLAPGFMVTKALAEHQLETVLEDFMPSEAGLYAVYPYSRFVSEKVRIFIDYLVQEWN